MLLFYGPFIRRRERDTRAAGAAAVQVYVLLYRKFLCTRRRTVAISVSLFCVDSWMWALLDARLAFGPQAVSECFGIEHTSRRPHVPSAQVDSTLSNCTLVAIHRSRSLRFKSHNHFHHHSLVHSAVV